MVWRDVNRKNRPSSAGQTWSVNVKEVKQLISWTSRRKAHLSMMSVDQIVESLVFLLAYKANSWQLLSPTTLHKWQETSKSALKLPAFRNMHQILVPQLELRKMAPLEFYNKTEYSWASLVSLRLLTLTRGYWWHIQRCLTRKTDITDISSPG